MRHPADVVSTNTRSTIAFGPRPQDAGDLARPVNLVPAQRDLSRLPRFTAAVRLLDDQADTAACTARTRSLPPAVRGRATDQRLAARRHIVPAVAGPGVDSRRGTCGGNGSGL
ncbi:hypothetical protein AB1484_35045 [Parafrankia sp. FMc6]|uniref:hypothetical protein n=1 Tax=Parafrankia soli TaxID=2599596 RepID=UPI0034D68763